jgi:hypothetical protein
MISKYYIKLKYLGKTLSLKTSIYAILDICVRDRLLQVRQRVMQFCVVNKLSLKKIYN